MILSVRSAIFIYFPDRFLNQIISTKELVNSICVYFSYSPFFCLCPDCHRGKRQKGARKNSPKTKLPLHNTFPSLPAVFGG